MRILKNIVEILFVLLILPTTCLHASNTLNGVKQFNKSVYRAASQNWSVSSNSNGMIYFANHKGLLEFDGSTWQLHELPNQTILRSVEVYADSIIFTSGYQELGYWTKDILGKLQYHSLNPLAERYFSKNIEFWNIISSDKAVYFHSFIGILCYESDSIKAINLPGMASTMNTIGDNILVAIKDKGLFRITGNEIQPFLTHPFFNDKLVRFILPYKNKQLLLGTEASGLFIWDGKMFKQWKSDWKEYFCENELNRGHYSSDGNLILGTIKDGIVIFDKNEKLTRKVNVENGLLNNTVLGMTTDAWGNIWLGLDDGINFIPANANQSYTIENIPGIGAIYATAIVGNKTYFGTNQGLFVREGKSDLEFIPGTQGQVWDCQVIDGKLWVGHNQGTFVVENNTARLISNFSGGFSIRKDNTAGSYIQSTYTSLVKYTQDNNGNIQHKNIDDFFDLIRYLEIDHLGNIWASHMRLGVFKIITDDKREKAIKTTYYGENDFGQNHSAHVFKVENRIVFTTGKKLFTYDDLNDSIIAYNNLNQQLGKYVCSHRIIKAPNHHYWFITTNNIGLFQITKDKTVLIKEYPALLFGATPLVDKFENILPLSDKKAILCLQNGIAHLDASQNAVNSEIKNHKPKFQQLEVTNNKGFITAFPLNSTDLEIKNIQNNLNVRIAFPHLSNLPLTHSFLLEGLDTEWSEKHSEPEFTFERLPSGKYILNIKTSDIWGNESQTLKLPFEVLPPWYLSTLAILLYIVLLIAVLFAFWSWGIRQTKRKEQQQHEKREKELIKLRNEKLRNEVQYKSKELASSTMAIIKKNEFLLDLKKSVEKQKSELGTRYPDKYYNHLNKKIDENISSRDDWTVFETNFERAHEQFFLKMKKSFPKLTSSDLRLCAYLKMNLSSKEIAPLLGISVRGVENHRYRLRKKMNLQHDDSLTDRILSV